MDSEQLHQVLLNLVLNGMQAIEGEGRITIAAKVDAPGGPGQADLVEISVSDTGVGIPPESLERIFRPFYTTKRGGTGLGLSLCRRIIRQHGGTLTVESKAGKRQPIYHPPALARGSRGTQRNLCPMRRF